MDCRLIIFVAVFTAVVDAACPGTTSLSGATKSTASMSTAGFTSQELSSSPAYKVHHRVVNDEILELILEMSDTTNNWMGFGFAEQSSGHMKGSDMVTVKVGDTGVTVDDRYAGYTATTYSSGTGSYVGLAAIKDDYNDWKLIDATYDYDGTTHTSFVYISRPIATGDNQDRDVGLGPRRIIWAYGSGSVGYHGANRGSGTIEFRPIPVGSSSPDSVADVVTLSNYDHSVDLLIDSFQLTSSTTQYVCQSFELPSTGRFSVKAIHPLNHVTNTAHAHHGLLHICVNNAYYTDHLKTQNGPKVCDGTGASPGLGHQSSECGGIMYSWAVGMNDFVLNGDLGIPIGNGATDIQYVILEVHYDNPGGLTTIVDNFGMRLYYDDGAPTTEVGVMTIGDPIVSVNNHGFESNSAVTKPFTVGPIVAGESKSRRQGTCPGTCSSEFASDVTVFASFLHMHYYGHKIVLEHYDSTKQLIGTRGRIDFWDNGYQHMIQGSDANFTFKKGESLHTQCYYDSSTSSSNINFGGSTADEMCMIFIMYYPRQFRGQDSNGKDIELSICGLSKNANGNDLAQTCGSHSMNGASEFVGDHTTDQIDAVDVYASSVMSSTSSHTCYPNGYPTYSKSSSNDEVLSTIGIIGVAVGGTVAVAIAAVGYHLYSIGYFSHVALVPQKIVGDEIVEVASGLEEGEKEEEL